MTGTVHTLSAMTDIEASHRGHAQAVERVRQLEQQMEAAFAGLHEARQGLKDRAGVDALTHFTEPMTCAFERWLAIYEAKTKADAPVSQLESDRHREDAVLALANASHAG